MTEEEYYPHRIDLTRIHKALEFPTIDKHPDESDAEFKQRANEYFGRIARIQERDFILAVTQSGIAQIYGIVRKEDESDFDFTERLVARMEEK